MGWMRTIFLGDIGNRLDIEDTEQEVQRLRRRLTRQGSRDGRQDERIKALELENEELKLCLAGLMRTLVAKGVCTQEELVALAMAVDNSEGGEVSDAAET